MYSLNVFLICSNIIGEFGIGDFRLCIEKDYVINVFINLR